MDTPGGKRKAESVIDKKVKKSKGKKETKAEEPPFPKSEKLELPGKYYLRHRDITDDTPDCLCKISKTYTSPALHAMISASRLAVSGTKGYRLSRGTHPVKSGGWYYEVEVEANQGHVRVGWAQGQADADLPCGCELWSYSYRDREGTAFTNARPRPYGQPYTTGDVIGCYIELPEGLPIADVTKPKGRTKQKSIKAQTLSAACVEEQQVVYWGQMAYHVVTHKETHEVVPHKGSKIKFFKNGEDQGVAFHDVCHAAEGYYPAVSVFKNARVTYNFGPDFKYPPPTYSSSADIPRPARAVCELGEEDAAKDAAAKATKSHHKS